MLNILLLKKHNSLKNLYYFVLKQVDTYGKNIIVVGLDGEPNRKNFGVL